MTAANLSRVMRKSDFCILKKKAADRLLSNHTTDPLHGQYSTSLYFLNHIFQASSYLLWLNSHKAQFVLHLVKPRGQIFLRCGSFETSLAQNQPWLNKNCSSLLVVSRQLKIMISNDPVNVIWVTFVGYSFRHLFYQQYNVPLHKEVSSQSQGRHCLPFLLYLLKFYSLRKGLRTHKVFTKGQYFYLNYHKFSIKSYVLDVY